MKKPMVSKLMILAALTLPAMAFAAGEPDLSGTWSTGPGRPLVYLKDGTVCMFGCEARLAAEGTVVKAATAPRAAPEKPDRPVYKPEFRANVADLTKMQVKEDPYLRCGNPGLPRIGPPAKIIQRPGEVVFLYDENNGAFWRIIPTDGRAHRTDVDPNALGDSVGRWENGVLVIDTIRFDPDTSWLTNDGAFHTASLRVTEYLELAGDSIRYSSKVEDTVLAEPWLPRPTMLTRASEEIQQPAKCQEEDVDRITDLDQHH